ncbi:chitosanase of glycosyl hydrolase group 75 [Streptoalloteichus tenebrarius]|uniref:Chitosanase of glycosyl hydrolase group 75 n=1 Tax=Streptoalloteichus tenebrarius (strain ATCC 17920 / DSM 40477 / JCM 4838 / CBS 697.72 / NBRC 16177 / NCIMB 11028 / NRRL B-12390 / A12253. 1 / ISP 5477) TaxID=1933 RepID=A0ABT1I3T8_STRSD|nr:glycoside hydrolase family 75 protein [Streptoalloteichus tenebrarius]MCP2262452.1 chitosanase of glycosyl hydrolase group 75 [Streptoalloteichus tenebrarius]BFF00426.1 glycoside hydrolase family 75 protein [Streptoalloteichus tenebrarius]
MRVRSVLVSGLVGLSALVLSTAPATASEPAADGRAGVAADGPTAKELLAKVTNCKQISQGKYARDAGGSSTVPVCGAKGAVFWKADMDIDCDGQVTKECNKKTDPAFQPETACEQSNGKPLIASKLPYIVVPNVSSRWDYKKSKIGCGTVGAVIYKDKVVYGVVGDVGPKEIIGEASYAMAKKLGIDPDPSTGGVDSGVTYILFNEGGKAKPIENPGVADSLGRELARKFVAAN